MGFIIDAFIEGTNGAISGVVEEIIATKAKQVIQKVFENEVIKEKLQELEEMQQEYLRNCYKKNRYMNTIVLRGQKKTIEELYIPLTLINRVNRRDIFFIDENGMNIFQKNDKILVIDNAGMGKSTIVKYFTMLNFQNMDKMPVVIELRNLKGVNSIEEYIQKEMNSIHREFPLQYVKDLLNGGDFIICFDGFDEVAENERKNVIKMIKDFVAKAGNNIFVLTSREDNALASFGEFKEFHIQGLSEQKAYQLIEKYSKADEFVDSVEIGQELINKLKTENDISMLTEFLSNPLMVSLLYKTYLHYRNIPNKKHLFYNQIYRALYEEHDLTKSGYQHIKKSGLDIEEMKIVLSYLGWYFVKNEIVECTEKQLIDMIEKILKKLFLNKEIKAKDFLEDILQAVPFFIKEGEYCRWTHKSFSEYFAACFVSTQKSKKAIEKILLEEFIGYYINVLDFCFDMSEDIKNTIIYNVVENFISYYNSSYQDECYKQFDEDLIKMKKNCDFCYDYVNIHILSSYATFNSSIANANMNILNLLYEKKIGIFSPYSYHINNTINNEDKNSLLEFVKAQGNYRNFKYEDDKNSIVNSKKYMEYFISQVFSTDYIFEKVMIDYDKCVAMKKSIEKYWARQEEDEDIFD